MLSVLNVCIAFTQTHLNNDIKRIEAHIRFDTILKSVSGNLQVYFTPLRDNDTLKVDAKQMRFSDGLLNGDSIEIYNDSLFLKVAHTFKKGQNYKLEFNYKATPKKALYFIDWDNPDGQSQIWSQGQGQYTSHWLPSRDAVADKIEFDLSFSFNSKYELISNGKLIAKTALATNETLWSYTMDKPMSSYLVAVAIGNYDSFTTTSNSGVPLQQYFYTSDSASAEPTYRYTETLFNTIENEIGVDYPWQNYKQVPVKDFLYAGMENTTATIFSDSFLTDSIAFKDQNYVAVNAHELAHQWFGNLVTASSSEHHWLQEGFSTYFALVAEKQVFGDDHFAWKLYQSALKLEELNSSEQQSGLLNPKASSLTFYEHGAWMVYALKDYIGAAAFNKSIKQFLSAYAYKTATTDDFFNTVGRYTSIDLNTFKAQWVLNAFPSELALDMLFNTYKWIEEFHNLDCLKLDCAALLKAATTHPKLKARIIKTHPELISIELFSIANHDVKIALSESFDSELHKDLIIAFEGLLQEPSYAIVENMLYKLWSSSPSKRINYLENTKDLIGFRNKNIRILWLALALATPEYNALMKSDYFRALEHYTSSSFGFETRQQAFLLIQSLDAFTDFSKSNLIAATKHHNWRFRTFARDLAKSLQMD